MENLVPYETDMGPQKGIMGLKEVQSHHLLDPNYHLEAPSHLLEPESLTYIF